MPCSAGRLSRLPSPSSFPRSSLAAGLPKRSHHNSSIRYGRICSRTRRTPMRPSHGFTLIELLVVIAIIGILSSVVLASLNTARRVSDLESIRTALELYYSSNNAYPNTSSNWVSSTAAQPWIPGLTSTYISSVPKDPANIGSPELYYYYNSNGSLYCMQFSQENTCSSSPYYWGVWNGSCKLRIGDLTWCQTH